MYCYFIPFLHALNLNVSNSFADVYEEVLEIVSYMTFFSPTISLDMWSLWPLMMEALNDWAIDFFESMSNFMIWHYTFCSFVSVKKVIFVIIIYRCVHCMFLHHCCVPILKLVIY